MHWHIKDNMTLTRILSIFIGKHGSSGTHRVEGDPGNRPDSPASVVGGQASHAPPMNEPEQVVGGTMGILQQLA